MWTNRSRRFWISMKKLFDIKLNCAASHRQSVSSKTAGDTQTFGYESVKSKPFFFLHLVNLTKSLKKSGDEKQIRCGGTTEHIQH